MIDGWWQEQQVLKLDFTFNSLAYAMCSVIVLPVPRGSCTPDMPSSTELLPDVCTPRTATWGRGSSLSRP